RRLALWIRHRIAKGEWQTGDQLPTVEQLSKELAVAKVTVRQAYALLSAEGILSSQRGRGTIVQRTPHEQSEGLRSAINDVDVDPEHLTIRILEQESDVARPPYGDLHGVFQAPYVRLFKLHI